MAVVLRDYQIAATDRLRAAIRRVLSVLLVSPTGSGKTRMFSWLTSRLTANGRRVVLLAHREELLDQISRALTDVDVRHGMIVAGMSYYDPRVLAHVASVFTIARRLDAVAVPDYVIVDEGHHAAAGSTWAKVVAHWRALNPRLVVIGVTATPERLDGKGLGDVYDELVMGPTAAELIAEGYLSPYALFSPPGGVDMTGVKRTAGDYNKAEANARTDKPKITGSAVEHYRRILNGAPAVAFCTSIGHAIHVAEGFVAQGFRAASIDGSMDKTTRRDILRDFAQGRLNVLTSCDLISEGFDVPGIVGAILLRPTQSLSLYLQQVGRALRPIYRDGADLSTREGRLEAIARGPKPKAMILDHVGNAFRPKDGAMEYVHGLPDDDREWSLEGGAAKRSKPKDPDALPTKQCPTCYAHCKAVLSKCPECAHVFVVKVRKVEEVEGDLQQIDPDEARRIARVQQGQAQSVEALMALGKNRGEAQHILEARAAKEALRMEARELAARLPQRIPDRVILALKPKQLREFIAEAKQQLQEQAA